MFTIKATYCGQTRKATFQDHNSFPTYFEICLQLHRLFPITQDFALSRLLFSPDASRHNILISKEVRSANDYASCVRPYKDFKWSNALLKFMIIDTDSMPGIDEFVSRTVEELSGTPSFSTPSLHAMQVDQTPTAATSVRSSENPLPHRSSMSSVSSCCSVAESKAEVKAMLDDLQAGLNRVISTNLQEPLVVSPQNSRDSRNSSETGNNTRTPPSLCSNCSNHIAPSEHGPLIWFSCADCHHVVCRACHQKGTTGRCSKAHGLHRLKFMKSFPSRPLPSPWMHPHRSRHRPASFVSTANSLPPEPRSDEVNSGASGASRPVVHAGVICDACTKTIHGVRHKCLDCRNYDLCTRCITTGSAERHNPFHEFYEIREPGRVVVHTVFDGERQREASATSARNDEPSPSVVHTANCDLCDSRISGDRYKCVVCPDFDTCSSCFTITDVQHPNHSFVKLTRRDDLIHRHGVHSMHYATCDACQKTIYGTRYKCMHSACPDYDLCQNCEALPIACHPVNHPMLKMKTSDAVVPVVYRGGQHVTHTFGSTTPTPGPRTDIRGTGSPDTPVGATRTATPTPASVGLETVPMEQVTHLFSSTNNIVASPPKATSMNPFADIFSVDPNPSLPPPLTPAALKAETVLPSVSTGPNFWPAVNDAASGVLPGAVYDELPAVTALSEEPESAHSTDSDPQPQGSPILPNGDPQTDDTNHSTELFTVRESLASLIRELPTLIPPPASPSAEDKISVPRISLSAAFVEDVTVPDGQVFPPGAEFVKCWRLMNDSGVDWPEATQLVFLAGDSLSAAGSAAIAVPVGKTGPGETVDLWTGELKAPEVPGRYVGYWRLKANEELFGNSLWVDINVVEADAHHSSEESMASSSVIMPAASSAPQSERVPSVTVTTLSTQTHSLASVTDDNLSDAGSDMSLISMPSSPSDDELWHDTKSRPSSNLSGAPTPAAPGSSAASPSAATGMDYVLLYDDESDDERK